MSTQTTAPVLEVNEETFPSSDWVPMETEFHRYQMNLLIELARMKNRGRPRYHVGGNQFIYWDRNNARLSAGPDFFYVDDVEIRMREKWLVWEEGGRFPDVILELLSPTTKHKDEGPKKDVFGQIFKTPEYFLFDPRTRRLQGWRLIDEVYASIEPDVNGRLECEQLGVTIGLCESSYLGWDDKWLRFFLPDGTLVPTYEEFQAQRADEHQQQAEQNRQEADEQRREAAEQRREAIEQQSRAEAAEAEVARLRAMLQQNTSRTNGGNGDPRQNEP